jgi:mono/diheme cytochrome c family protein
VRRVLPFLLLAFVLAGCGGKKVVMPTASTVVGSVPTTTTTQAVSGNAKSGEALFASEGCTGCHTFKAANAHGTVGPDLDKLPQYAKAANMGSLSDFIHESIVNPGAYVEKGYSNVMPNFGSTLSAKQVADLEAFLKQNLPSG